MLLTVVGRREPSGCYFDCCSFVVVVVCIAEGLEVRSGWSR